MIRPTVHALAFAVALAVAALPTRAFADVYDDAVAHAGRSDKDHARDANESPAAMMRLAGIRPGMTVVDFFAGGGYYSELLADVVGPKGHVLLVNNKAYDDFSQNAWKTRIETHHLANVEHRTVDPAAMQLGSGTVDAIVLNKVYHDLYWVDAKDGWPKIDAGSVLDQLAAALKPGGTVLIVDHSAKAGTASAAAQTIHRIDEAFMRKDFESHGFAFVAKSDALRKPDDARDESSFEGPMVGKTDRFAYVFRKAK